MKRRKGQTRPYQLINLILGSIIGCILLYFAIFSSANASYPVPSFFTKLTGLPSISTGLSHSLSAMLRGDLAQAQQFNSFGPGIFFFFVSQLLLRIVVFLFIQYSSPKIKILAIADISLSIPGFLFAFKSFIIFTIKLGALVLQQW